LPGQKFFIKSNLRAKTRAEHGTVVTEEPQALLSKNLRKISPFKHYSPMLGVLLTRNDYIIGR
jgi:hypothetical protein